MLWSYSNSQESNTKRLSAFSWGQKDKSWRSGLLRQSGLEGMGVKWPLDKWPQHFAHSSWSIFQCLSYTGQEAEIPHRKQQLRCEKAKSHLTRKRSLRKHSRISTEIPEGQVLGGRWSGNQWCPYKHWNPPSNHLGIWLDQSKVPTRRKSHFPWKILSPRASTIFHL